MLTGYLRHSWRSDKVEGQARSCIWGYRVSVWQIFAFHFTPRWSSGHLGDPSSLSPLEPSAAAMQPQLQNAPCPAISTKFHGRNTEWRNKEEVQKLLATNMLVYNSGRGVWAHCILIKPCINSFCDAMSVANISTPDPMFASSSIWLIRRLVTGLQSHQRQMLCSLLLVLLA